MLGFTKGNEYINGIILVDKPAGITSFDVVEKVRERLKIRRVGHLGTLDPFATGILPILLGESTKLFQFLSKLDKRYIGTLELGKRTTTGDPTGEIIETKDVTSISKETVESAINSLKGEFMQDIPVYSAKKINGKPSYEWARMGIVKTPAPQKALIKDITIKSIDIPFIEFEIEVSSGTYIRSWAEKIGEILGVGGYLKSLRRIKYGNFDVSDALTMDELETLSLTNRDKIRIIIPYDALSHIRTLEVPDKLAEFVRNGTIIRKLRFPFRPYKNELIKVVDKNKNLLAIIEYTPDQKIPYKYKRVFNIWKQ